MTMLARMGDNQQHWENLNHHMTERALDLNIPWREVEQRAGISGTMLRRIRNGQANRVTSKTARAIENALRWEYGSVHTVLTGGEPTELETNIPKPAPQETPQSAENTIPLAQQPPIEDAELAVIHYWSSYVGQAFTREAFYRLMDDVRKIREQAISDALNSEVSEQ